MITKKYQIFLKVARLGSISNAAKALGQTESSVTQALHALEGELHLTLFDRSRTGVTLTAQGKALLPYVEAVEESENRLLSYAADLAAKKQTVLRIGTFTSVAVNWLPELFQKYKAVEPGIRFEMKDIGYNNIEEIRGNWQQEREFLPSMSTYEKEERVRGWQHAVEQAML